MSKRRTQKEIITQAVLDNLPPEVTEYKNSKLEQIIFRWWVTGRTGQGLRLTDEGKNAFQLAEIEHYDYPMVLKTLIKKKDKLKLAEFTINIGKKISCPFYLGQKTDNKKTTYIRIYDSKVAMMISLYGDIFEYLESRST